MKKLMILISITTFLISCESNEMTYPDFTYQTVYFPVQYPVRNIELGESRFDNSIDLEHAFTIGVNISGLYKNTKNRVVFVKYAPELVKDSILTTDKGDTIKLLPENYYTNDLKALDKIVIPAGSINGRIKINLTDAFFADAKSVGVRYVIPLVILPATEDSVLTGIPVEGNTNPDRFKSADWQTGYLPMDFTLFGLKYTNKFHGNYFHYGVDSTFQANVFTKTSTYSTKFVEDNAITLVKTVSLTESTIDRLGGANTGDKYTILIKVNEDKSVGISSVPNAKNDQVNVTGSGKLIDDMSGVVWGGKAHKTFVLKYEFTDANGLHKCKDTLVYRTSSIVYQDFILKQ